MDLDPEKSLKSQKQAEEVVAAAAAAVDDGPPLKDDPTYVKVSTIPSDLLLAPSLMRCTPNVLSCLIKISHAFCHITLPHSTLRC